MASEAWASEAWTVFAGVDFAPWRLFDTTDLDEARERCARVLNPHALEVLGRGQRLHARMAHRRLGPLSLNRLSWQAPVAVDPGRLDDYYLLSLPVRGEAVFHLDGETIDVTPQRPAIVSGAQRFRLTASEGFDQIVLRFERSALRAAWQALSGAAPAGEVNFSSALPTDSRAWQVVAPALRLLADSPDVLAGMSCDTAESVAAWRHHHARIEDMLLTGLLLAQPHHLTAVVPSPSAGAAPRHLRRAEAFMAEHLTEPLTLSRVALAAGVASRTLQAAFLQAHGHGPMQWLRARRLQAAHAALRGAQGERVSVADTAMALGFSHLGEFSAAYRRRFGETPSQTLARRG